MITEELSVRNNTGKTVCVYACTNKKDNVVSLLLVLTVW